MKDAVGFDQTRGDSVNVVNASFHSDAAPADTQLEKVSMWETPAFQEIAKLGAGLLLLVVLATDRAAPV